MKIQQADRLLLKLIDPALPRSDAGSRIVTAADSNAYLLCKREEFAPITIVAGCGFTKYPCVRSSARIGNAMENRPSHPNRPV